MKFNAPLHATAIGSFPHPDADKACSLILECFASIPIWPQLTKTSLLEQMEIQFSEGLPCLVVDEGKERMYFDTSGDPTAALEKFYENVLGENVDYFAISSKYSRGIYAMETRLKEMDRSGMKYFKMQVTGPLSFGLTIVDENKRAIYYNDIFRDVVIKAVCMKARWQIEKFKPLCQNLICFIDEPILSAFGSSTYVSVKREDIVVQLKEVVDAIHNQGAWAGMHCCGNTEWTIPIDAGVDILNFDAFGYSDSLALYPAQIQEFLRNDGVLAWGIVPTSEKIDQETTDSLAERFSGMLDSFSNKGINRDLLITRALITPSCGTGSVPVERSERIVRQTKALSDFLRAKYL
jgi:hypothetical protein